ncbi:helix-turn-helix domain-containing protein [Vogesella urethralis]|uniref:helix-turn-helix domain-containing protein n=1 Tax=Vogesella urethralis TaxID=2592656 RepID=UPI00147908E4
MQLHTFVKQLHLLLEARNGGRITRDEMATRLGVSRRTYTEYLRGVNKPLGMRALLDLLCQLEERDQVELLRRWREGKLKQTHTAIAENAPMTRRHDPAATIARKSTE